MGTVAEWSERFGHLDPFEKKPRKGFDWQYRVAYCCEIAAAKISVSQRGDKQIQLDLRVLDGDRNDAPEIGRAIEFFTLPKQDSDLNLDPELVKKIHRRRFLDILRVLSVGDPSTYNLYARAEHDGSAKRFIGYDGKPMDKEAFAYRERQIHADCQLWVDNAHERVNETLEELEGGRIYIEKIKNPRSEKFPWTNIYANRSHQASVYSTHEAPF